MYDTSFYMCPLQKVFDRVNLSRDRITGLVTLENLPIIDISLQGMLVIGTKILIISDNINHLGMLVLHQLDDNQTSAMGHIFVQKDLSSFC